jgi:DNA-binding NarL/FixJ family response regulator
MIAGVNTGGDGLRQAREALDRGDSAAARVVFEVAVADRPCGDSLAGLAEALYVERDYVRCRSLFERAHAAYRDERNALGAYRTARIVARFYGGQDGEWALYNGWMGRARSVLEESDDQTDASAERGRLELLKATGPGVEDIEREARFRAALAIGRQIGDADLEFQALAFLGGHLVFTDRVDEGMPLLDQALAGVCAGEVTEFSLVDEIFCGLLASCERAHDVARAEQWIRAASEISERRKLVSIAAFCRAHYGGILTAAGRWADAERELLTSSRMFADNFRFVGVNAVVRLADLRVRQGRLEEAARLLKGLEEHADAARPLAALYLARGELALAQDRIERILAEPKLTAGVAAPLYSLLVDVHLAGGRIEEAAAAADQLAERARDKPTDFVRASAALAKGKVCLASSSGDARRCLLEAVAAFSRAEMPVELARTRIELARAVAADRPEVAIAEASAALEALEGLQAHRDAAVAADLLRQLGAPVRPSSPANGGTLSKREAEVLNLLGHGLTNGEIGDRLYISRRTVEHHVGSILSKLGLRSRTEAAAHAVRAAEK